MDDGGMSDTLKIPLDGLVKVDQPIYRKVLKGMHPNGDQVVRA